MKSLGIGEGIHSMQMKYRCCETCRFRSYIEKLTGEKWEKDCMFDECPLDAIETIINCAVELGLSLSGTKREKK